LDRGQIVEIAKVDEETFEPVKDYTGDDWPDVKRKQSSSMTFAPGAKPLIQIETTTSLIKLSGSLPFYSYWLETDGTWHARKSNWSARSAQQLKAQSVTKRFLVWNASEGRFVDDQNQ